MQKSPFWLVFFTVISIVVVSCDNSTFVDGNAISLEKITTDTSLQGEIPEPICNCEDSSGFDINQEPELSFSASDPLENDRTIAGYTSHNMNNGAKIKSISFVGWDTIPDRYSIFSNVEYVHIRPGGEGYTETSFSGLNIFPKLKGILFRGCFVKINPEEKWVKNIEVLTLEKSRLSGLKSFSQLPKLRELFVGHSGFEYFPDDFEKLQCLKKAYFGSYRFQKDSTAFTNQKKPECLDTMQIAW